MRKYLMSCVAVMAYVIPASAQQTQPRDAFYYLNELNKAANVMVVETGIVPRPLGKQIAESIATVAKNADANPKLRSGDYLAVEPLYIDVGGPDVTRLHSGRSRQEIGAVSRRLSQRDKLLATMVSLDKSRAALLTWAAKYPNALVPSYTHGVQAQPISFGHYLLAYSEVLERDSARLRAAFNTANQSAMGSAALGTSSFPIDRKRLAQLMGFDGIIVNSLDANELAPIDAGVEISSVAASMALSIGTFASDIEAQYYMSTPWILLTEGELTGTSSIMPQKRNPSALERLRLDSSRTVGDAMLFFVSAHNVTAGMNDYKGAEPERALSSAITMLDDVSTMIPGLLFNEKRALDEVNADYSVTTELADILQRDAGVPFRVGHHFASEMVEFGRAARLRPAEIKYADAKRIFSQAARDFKLKDTNFPLTEARFRVALTAENMVASAKPMGGPQPSEVMNMLRDQQAQLQKDKAWTTDKTAALDASSKAMNDAFEAIRAGN
jgi:argininosuccinate lyase